MRRYLFDGYAKFSYTFVISLTISSVPLFSGPWIIQATNAPTANITKIPEGI